MRQTKTNSDARKVKKTIGLFLCFSLLYFIFPVSSLAQIGGRAGSMTTAPIINNAKPKPAGTLSPAAAAALADKQKTASATTPTQKVATIKKQPKLQVNSGQLPPTNPAAKVATGKVIPKLIPPTPSKTATAGTGAGTLTPGVKKVGAAAASAPTGGDTGGLLALVDKPVAAGDKQKGFADPTKVTKGSEGADSPDSKLIKAAGTDKFKSDDATVGAADPSSTQRLADAAKRTEQQLDKQRAKPQDPLTDTTKIEQVAKRAERSLPESADPAFRRMVQPPTKFRRFADTSRLTREMSKRLSGEIKPTFSRLTNISDGMVRLSPKLINAELSPKLTKLATVSKNIEISSLANKMPNQLNSKFEKLATISPNKFNFQSQFKGAKIVPQLANLRDVSFQVSPSISEVKSYQISSALKGLNRFLPKSEVNFSLPDTNRIALTVKSPLASLSDLSRIAGLKSTGSQALSKAKELKRSFANLASVSKNSDKILLEGLAPMKASSLRIVSQQQSQHNLTQLKVPKFGFIRLLHGDNGSRLPAIQALELSGINVQDLMIVQDQIEQDTSLLIAGNTQILNSPTLSILDADGQLGNTFNSILLSSDVITRQLIIRSVR
ncbi:MAG: hypothetical protein K9L86_00245 [Candidatus Omnitrophica bacterium]|nr:hypothetical protein [Candidatus Omnitrophota bacterium]